MERVPFRATVAAEKYDHINKLPVSLLLDNIRSMYNVGSFFRTADGAGAEALYLSGITARPPKNAITKTALGAEDSVLWHPSENAVQTVDTLRHNGYEIAAIETSVNAVDLYDWQPKWPVLLLFGHEVDGIGEDLLNRCDTFVRLPMLGLKHSLNVSNAAAIVLYELLRKYRHA
jgi:23S rRNA (guanosine2251-2'-O)-methyltransferase